MEEISIVQKIKAGPYWRVNIRPSQFNREKIQSLSEIRKLLEKCRVSLRGWDFPHIDDRKTTYGQDWVQSECEFDDIKEYWRFYKSAQFIHYFSVYEDYYMKSKQSSLSSMGEYKNLDHPSGYVEILVTIFRMTEIYEFAMRLAQKGVYDKGVSISITLSGIKNYRLFFSNSLRVLFRPYISTINQITLDSKMSTEELLAKGHDEAIEKSIQIFESFSWLEPPRNIFIEDQKKFLERRL